MGGHDTTANFGGLMRRKKSLVRCAVVMISISFHSYNNLFRMFFSWLVAKSNEHRTRIFYNLVKASNRPGSLSISVKSFLGTTTPAALPAFNKSFCSCTVGVSVGTWPVSNNAPGLANLADRKSRASCADFPPKREIACMSHFFPSSLLLI